MRDERIAFLQHPGGHQHLDALRHSSKDELVVPDILSGRESGRVGSLENLPLFVIRQSLELVDGPSIVPKLHLAPLGLHEAHSDPRQLSLGFLFFPVYDQRQDLDSHWKANNEPPRWIGYPLPWFQASGGHL